MRLQAAPALSLSLLVLGCGDDAAKDGTRRSTGLAGSKQLVELTDEEAEKLCEFVRDENRANLTSERAYCLRDTDPVFCEEDLADCVGSGRYEAALQDDWSCRRAGATTFLSGAECAATIGEYEACVREAEQQQRELFAEATCDNLAAVQEDEGREPASCARLYDKCPDLDF